MCSVRRHKNTDADGFILRFSSIFVCPLNAHAAERLGRKIDRLGGKTFVIALT